MSLIYGISLPKKIYLVSDTRITSSDGSTDDDFSKWLDINARIGVVVADNAHMASWFLRKFIQDTRRNGVNKDWDFSELDKYLKNNLFKYAQDYFAIYKDFSRSACFIFGGFDSSTKLKINAGLMGDAMAALPKAAGALSPVSQTIDMEIFNAFREVHKKNTLSNLVVDNTTSFEVDLPRPRIVAVSISANEGENPQITWDEANCLDGIAFNPNFKVERVKLPPRLLGDLEYRDRTGEQGQDVHYVDNGIIITFSEKLIAEKGWETVGGEIIPLYIDKDTVGIAVGEYISKNPSAPKQKGGTLNVNGKLSFRDNRGEIKQFRDIHDYLDSFQENSEAKL